MNIKLLQFFLQRIFCKLFHAKAFHGIFWIFENILEILFWVTETFLMKEFSDRYQVELKGIVCLKFEISKIVGIITLSRPNESMKMYGQDTYNQYSLISPNFFHESRFYLSIYIFGTSGMKKSLSRFY